jgi:hypothetical protein
MTAALINTLHEAGLSCRELFTWCRCSDDGAHDHCEGCPIGGPDRCESQVIKSLAVKLVACAEQTDAALLQRDHWKGQRDRWKGIADRLADKFMEGESCRHSVQKRHR